MTIAVDWELKQQTQPKKLNVIALVSSLKYNFPQGPVQSLPYTTKLIYNLAHWIRISDILSWARNSYLTHVILPRLSCVRCLMLVLEFTRRVVN